MATYMKYVMDIYFEVLSNEYKYDKFLLQQYWDETNTLVKNALSSYVASKYPSMVEEKTHENTCGYKYTKGKKSGELCGHKVVGPNRKTCYRHTPQLQCVKNQTTITMTKIVEAVEEKVDEEVKSVEVDDEVKSVEVDDEIKTVEVDDEIKTVEVDEEVKSVEVDDEIKTVENESVEVDEDDNETVESLFGDIEEEEEEEVDVKPKYCTFIPQKGKFKGTVCGHEVTGDKPHCSKHMKYPIH